MRGPATNRRFDSLWNVPGAEIAAKIPIRSARERLFMMLHYVGGSHYEDSGCAAQTAQVGTGSESTIQRQRAIQKNRIILALPE
jgi:predicted alpha-1,6-mannanase (GH76 family)